jgi:phosphatidylglycerol lysyltransferase
LVLRFGRIGSSPQQGLWPHGRRFYNFDGLDFFKSKLQPESWEPIYAVTRDRRLGLRDLYAIAGAFSGASPVTFLAHGLRRALAIEGSRRVRYGSPQ